MTILRLKNLTNIYRIDVKKKLGGERGYLALEDLRIKSKFSRSNMPIREVGRSGERKRPEREEKEEEESSSRKVGAEVKTPPRRHRSWRQARRQDLRRQGRRQDLRCQAWRQDLWRRAACQVTATSASNPRPRRRVHILKSYLQGHIYDFFLKRTKNKIFRPCTVPAQTCVCRFLQVCPKTIYLTVIQSEFDVFVCAYIFNSSSTYLIHILAVNIVHIHAI